VSQVKIKSSKLLPLDLDELHRLHHKQRRAIRKRLAEFSVVRANNYFYELAYCLLTPQSSAVNADKTISALRKKDFCSSKINPEPILRDKKHYIRFHKTKAKHLLAVKEQYPIIVKQLTSEINSTELREWLVKNVKGLGWKEASHFLRNIGYRDLAILDRHILKCLLRVGVLKRLPNTLTAKRYKVIEKKFLAFADKVDIPIDELDLIFWSKATGEILK
jgi:N-glycosylase/DNA lyase